MPTLSHGRMEDADMWSTRVAILISLNCPCWLNFCYLDSEECPQNQGFVCLWSALPMFAPLPLRRKKLQDCKMPPVLARLWCCIAVADQLGGSGRVQTTNQNRIATPSYNSSEKTRRTMPRCHKMTGATRVGPRSRENQARRGSCDAQK